MNEFAEHTKPQASRLFDSKLKKWRSCDNCMMVIDNMKKKQPNI